MTWNYTSFSFYLLQLPRNSLKCSPIVANGDKTDFKFCREYQVARYCDYLEIKYRKNCVKIEDQLMLRLTVFRCVFSMRFVIFPEISYNSAFL